MGRDELLQLKHDRIPVIIVFDWQDGISIIMVLD